LAALARNLIRRQKDIDSAAPTHHPKTIRSQRTPNYPYAQPPQKAVV
jgi:hypothetical protein